MAVAGQQCVSPIEEERMSTTFHNHGEGPILGQSVTNLTDWRDEIHTVNQYFAT